MQDITKIVQKTFEKIKIEDDAGFEFWSARELMNSLGYKEWRKFDGVIKKASVAFENSGIESKRPFCRSRQNGLIRFLK